MDLPKKYKLLPLIVFVSGCMDQGSAIVSLADAPVEAADVRVASSSGDMHEAHNGRVDGQRPYLYLVDDGKGPGGETAALRFVDVPVPEGATIVRAYVQFRAAGTDDVRTALSIHAEAADNAPPLRELRADLSSRPTTAASVTYAPDPWAPGESGAAQRTPDLSAVLNEVVGRPGWRSGNAVVLTVMGTGRRTAVTFDGSPSGAPLLHLEWAPPFVSGDASTVDAGSGEADAGSGTADAGAGGADSGSDPGTTSDGGTSCAAEIVEVRVAGGDEDMEEAQSGSVSSGSTDLELVDDGSSLPSQTVAMRFTSVGIPRGSQITTAHIQFTVDETDGGSVSLDVRAEASDDASPLSTSDFNLSSRTTTVAGVPWSPSPWTVVGDAGPEQRTPDLAAVVSEVVSRGGWASGNSMVFLVTGTGERTAESYNGDSAAAPLLHVEYAPPNCGTGVSCGDGTCDATEDCETCSSDCGACPAPSGCGDGTCDATEDCGSCSSDCGLCPGATTYVVAPDGSSSGAGTESSPWDLATALDGASGQIDPGDVVYLRGGTYFTRATAALSGVSGAPITIRSYPGEHAVIDSGYPEFQAPGNDAWELVDASIGEYRSRFSCASNKLYAYIPVPGYENERVMLVPYWNGDHFRATREDYVDSSTPFYVGPGT